MVPETRNQLLVIFHGKSADGHPVRLLQHVSQLSVLLVALPKVNKEPRRIGFELQKKLDPEKLDPAPDETA